MLRRVTARLNYANVTATLALFVALGGSSYAALTLPRNSVGTKQLRSGAVRSGDVRDGALRVRDLSRDARASLRGATGSIGPQGPAGAPAIKYFAVVEANGRLVRGSATSGGSAGSPGSYVVGFPESVAGCAYSATVGTADGTPAPAGRATVRSADTRVAVQTFDSAGNAADVPFHLIVAC
jgi:hypothetical protein